MKDLFDWLSRRFDGYFEPMPEPKPVPEPKGELLTDEEMVGLLKAAARWLYLRGYLPGDLREMIQGKSVFRNAKDWAEARDALLRRNSPSTECGEADISFDVPSLGVN